MPNPTDGKACPYCDSNAVSMHRSFEDTFLCATCGHSGHVSELKDAPTWWCVNCNYENGDMEAGACARCGKPTGPGTNPPETRRAWASRNPGSSQGSARQVSEGV